MVERNHSSAVNMPLNKKERALIVKLFYQNESNASAALRAYRRMKNLRRGPMSSSAVQRMIRKFEETGSLDVAPGRGRRATQPATVDEVAIATAAAAASSSNATVSGRSIARTLNIPWATVRMILRKILKLYPYKMHFVQQLKPHDHSARLDFALSFLARMQVDDNWPSHIFWTDEAHFHLDGAVNTQNCRIWGSTNPHAMQQQPLHSPYVTAWCGFTANFILGPYFFEDVTRNGFVRCTVTSDRYARLLEDHVVPALRQRGCLATTVFMQDGATAHTARRAKTVIQAHFPDERVISRTFPIAWPARSPDLNPCDFWLWGFLKDRVYQGSVTNEAELKASIVRHVSLIHPDMLRAVVEHAIVRFQHIVDRQGMHVEHTGM